MGRKSKRSAREGRGRQADRAGDDGGRRLRDLLLAALTALLVARPLVAGDAVAQRGDGMLFVMLWLLLAGGWFLAAARRGGLEVRWGAVEWLLVGALAWHTFSALLAARDGSPRLALSALWEGVGLGLGYFLARQLLCRAGEARIVVAVMLGIATGVATVGIYQRSVTMPRDLAMYEEIKDDREAMLREMQVWYPPGSAERRRLESRLEGGEPTGTFALANSLAGLLAPWLVVAVGLAVAGAWPGEATGGAARRWLAIGLPSLLIGACLLLTKSRSGVVAAVTGLVLLWPACRLRGGPRRRVALGLVAATVLLLASALAMVAGDRRLASEAGKSLGYRLQYWRSTLAMVADDPWLGCGPGQFQNNYTAYKLPEASEEIRDPHNFVFETWATAGTPAAVLLLAGLAVWAWQLLRGPDEFAADLPLPEEAAPHRGSRGAADGDLRDAAMIVCGAATGLLLAGVLRLVFGFPLGLDSLLIVAVVLAVTLFLLRPWWRGGPLPPRLLAVAAIVLLVHLLAAGGIGYPGVAGSLWLLVALALNGAARRRPRRVGRPLAVAGLAAVAVAVVALHLTAYSSVLRCRSLLDASFVVQGPRAEQERAALRAQAVAADPLSGEAARLLAEQRFVLWRARPGAASRAALEEAATEALRLAPRSAVGHGQVGRWYLELARAGGPPSDGAMAVRLLERAVALYPHSAALHADLSAACQQTGDIAAARRAASEALRLDAITRAAGHEDRYLADDVRARLQERAAGSD